ncbi:helix-turn-helix protein [Flavobacterium araucananum]|jgi:transcriptional regulator with XRE-family HTH domain|uniref:Transcriptional regulator n=1 Tax=Flavobacterium araucananum TaxID=946678 RepID=A0A227NLD4_9FLAO|nr:helix-turn-helix transcriptional regulator [Flavobacterium araucananum]OXE98640.1 transcriptional regulator [Flavobacterium araucananum]PWJ97216.1 helix-turn-helix protein [Flavobacterium araucananum]
MVNIDDFVKRLEIILDYYALNASSFADRIGVQRSSMSHLLSGRNKPSLDFVMKIMEVFPDVDLYWILNGKGSFPKNEDVVIEKVKTPTPTLVNENLVAEDLFSETYYKETAKATIKTSPEIKSQILNSEESEIEKIVIFYKNGTFKAYVP